ncbi:hypothetical protein QE152_g22301 [Popillia japonica]|uniref:Uncharacterized protein n=1 Tax=Popillia japonica TaxID=7064 RepID=A0AAW1KJ39_POPJA
MNSEGIKVMPKREETVTKNIDEANELPDLFLIDGGNNLDIGKSEYLSEIENMIGKYYLKEPKETKIVTKIILADEIPVYQQPRRKNRSLQADYGMASKGHYTSKRFRLCMEWLQKGIIRPSVSDYASPIVLVKKKDGNTHMC